MRGQEPAGFQLAFVQDVIELTNQLRAPHPDRFQCRRCSVGQGLSRQWGAVHVGTPGEGLTGAQGGPRLPPGTARDRSTPHCAEWVQKLPRWSGHPLMPQFPLL